MNKTLKKMIGIIGAAIMVTTYIAPMPVYAVSPVQSPYKIDGEYVIGSTATYDTSTAKFATANTIHKINSTKTVSVRGYYYLYSTFSSTIQKSNAAYTDPYVTVSVDCPSDSSPCGSVGNHAVYGSSSWSGSSSVGYIGGK